MQACCHVSDCSRWSRLRNWRGISPPRKLPAQLHLPHLVICRTCFGVQFIKWHTWKGGERRCGPVSVFWWRIGRPHAQRPGRFVTLTQPLAIARLFISIDSIVRVLPLKCADESEHLNTCNPLNPYCDWNILSNWICTAALTVKIVEWCFGWMNWDIWIRTSVFVVT